MNPTVTSGALVLAMASAVYAQEKPYTQPGTGQPAAAPVVKLAPPSEPAEPTPVEKLFNGRIPEAITKGKFNLNARLRFEYTEQDGVDAITAPSYAPTIRTRFGYTTVPLYGFQGMIEGEDVRIIGPEINFNAAGTTGVPYKPVVADPETTELNQAWLSYSYTNRFTIKGGRQRIALDNHRFIGDVGWRQNMQTFDAVALEGKPLEDLSLLYSYVWEVNRVFGDVPGLAAPLTDFRSHSHLVNASYSGWQYGRFVGYSYLLDLQNAGGNGASSATYGGYFAGAAPVTSRFSLGYRSEFAWQTDYADSSVTYEAEYYNVELSGAINPFALGAGYEVLGSDDGQAFRTPLATLHAFNGWADVFLNTPSAGLRDLYGFAQVTLPWSVPLRFVYHKFDAEEGDADFGQEFDVIASRKFGKYWTALVKYAFYDGQDAAPPAFDVPINAHKFWAQLEFNY